MSRVSEDLADFDRVIAAGERLGETKPLWLPVSDAEFELLRDYLLPLNRCVNSKDKAADAQKWYERLPLASKILGDGPGRMLGAGAACSALGAAAQGLGGAAAFGLFGMAGYLALPVVASVGLWSYAQSKKVPHFANLVSANVSALRAPSRVKAFGASRLEQIAALCAKVGEELSRQRLDTEGRHARIYGAAAGKLAALAKSKGVLVALVDEEAQKLNMRLRQESERQARENLAKEQEAVKTKYLEIASRFAGEAREADAQAAKKGLGPRKRMEMLGAEAAAGQAAMAIFEAVESSPIATELEKTEAGHFMRVRAANLLEYYEAIPQEHRGLDDAGLGKSPKESFSEALDDLLESAQELQRRQLARAKLGLHAQSAVVKAAKP